jgi:uroporphyrin-III C-methyltransferase/precorrin-2 dehydrogenase/sirohydrochlorin ferrochelatase
VAISTDGDAPALAGLVREGLEALVPDDIETWLDLSREQTRLWRETKIPMADRRPRLLEALNRLYSERTQ